MFKGQVEFIAIVGLIVIVVVVVFYAYQGGILYPKPAGIQEEQNLVKDSVTSFIRTGAIETLRNINEYGGYTKPDEYTNSVTFLGKERPYWYYNGRIIKPDLKTNFVNGLNNYIKDNKDFLLKSFKTNVTMGDPYVHADVFDDKILLTVNLPTSVKGYPISQPYKVEVQTKIGEIHDFSKNFVDFVNQKRPFEGFTVQSMFYSPIKDGINSVPFLIQLIGCGKSVHKNWFDVKPHTEYAVRQALANTHMPGKYEIHEEEASEHPQYEFGDMDKLLKCDNLLCIQGVFSKGNPFISKSITSPRNLLPKFNNKAYEDIDISFYVQDDFELTTNTFQFSPQPINIIPEPLPSTGICLSDPVYVNYFLKYPAVVVVKDKITGDLFKFAIDVYIKDNEAGDFTDVSGYVSETQDIICENPLCTANINVFDSSGNPVKDVSVTFMGCVIGKTDANGLVKGSIPCGLGPLEVYKNNYGSYNEMKNSDDVKNIDVTLKKTPFINLHFNRVVIDNNTLGSDYVIYKGSIQSLREGERTRLFFKPSSNSNERFDMAFDTRIGKVNYIPSDVYSITGLLMDSNFLQVFGSFSEIFEIKETDTDLYIYLPYMPEIADASDDFDRTMSILTLTAVLEKCGIGPISRTEFNSELPCSVSYDNVFD